MPAESMRMGTSCYESLFGPCNQFVFVFVFSPLADASSVQLAVPAFPLGLSYSQIAVKRKFALGALLLSLSFFFTHMMVSFSLSVLMYPSELIPHLSVKLRAQTGSEALWGPVET